MIRRRWAEFIESGGCDWKGGMEVQHTGDPFNPLRDPTVAHALDGAVARRESCRLLPELAGEDGGP